MASAGRGEIPPKSVPSVVCLFLFDFFRSKQRQHIYADRLRGRCPLTPDGLCRNLPQVGSPTFTPCGNCQIAPFSQLFDGLRRVAPGRGSPQLLFELLCAKWYSIIVQVK